MNSIGVQIFVGFVLPPLSALCWKTLFDLVGWGRFYNWVLGWGWSGLSTFFLSMTPPFEIIGVIGGGLNLLCALAVWWWKRRKRKRAAGLVGTKSRALVAALVRRAREAARPRPVLRPQPGGARCA